MSLRARIGAYLLTDVIGQGGMAVVYRAKREGWSGFEKTVVVKAMLPALAAHREHVDRFIAEAKISAQLSHPGIVQVHDFGVFQGTPYLVMEHVNGVNLSQLLNALAQAGRRLPVDVALVIATQVCHALGYAHAFRDWSGTRRQVIHSDVSPANVMVCRDGVVKLLDFGVAKVIDACDYDVSLTVRGKYPYMAPEQINGLPIDRRVDVFAAGIVLHEMLTGCRLFAAATELETLRRVDACAVAPPSRSNRDVPRALDAVVLRALARDPADRFDSGDEMAAALEQLEHAGGARKRVAAVVAELFPHSFAVICEVCGKTAAPGLSCAECGNAIEPAAPSTAKVRLEDVLSAEELAPAVDAPPPVEAPHAIVSRHAEPYHLPTVIDTRRPRAHQRMAALVGSIGVVAGLGLAVARMRLASPSRPSSSRVPLSSSSPPSSSPSSSSSSSSAPASRCEEPGTMCVAPPPPVSIVPPRPMAQNTQKRVNPPRPHARKNRTPMPQATPAPAPRPHQAIRDGALLEPFDE